MANDGARPDEVIPLEPQHGSMNTRLLRPKLVQIMPEAPQTASALRAAFD